jgi:serine/threonine protein kinase
MREDPLIGKQIDRYKIEKLIGSGGMASVYRAVDVSLGRTVAMKIIHQSIALSGQGLDRFKQEASVIIALEHPHLVPVYDFKVDQDPPYIVMRYLNGGTVADVIKEHQVVPLPEIAHILNQVAGALDHAHKKNVIHRDIKPSNIMIDKEGNAFLTDFGIARISGTTGMTATSMSVGTPGYMSPEQGQGENVDHRTDIYALGVMVFEMATGNPPYTSGDPFSLVLAHITRPIPSAHEFNPNLPRDFDMVMQRALAKAPANRYNSALALAHDIEMLAGGRAIAAATPTVLKRIAEDSAIPSDTNMSIASASPTTQVAGGTQKTNRSWVTAGIIGTIIVLILAGIGLFVLSQGDSDQSGIQTETAVALAQQENETQSAIIALEHATSTAEAQNAQATQTADALSMIVANAQAATQDAIDAQIAATAERENLIATNTALALTDQAVVAQLTTQAELQLTQAANAQATQTQQADNANATATQNALNEAATATQQSINLQATQDAIVQATQTQQADDSNATATQDAINAAATSTQSAQNTAIAQAATATQAAQATNQQATAVAQQTLAAGETEVAARATDVQATINAQLTIVVQQASTQAALNRQATLAARPTATYTPSSTAQNIDYGEVVQERVSDTDETLFTFYGRANEHVTISLESADFDTFLTLSQEDTVLTSDDDGGDGLNSRIQSFVLPRNDTYTIRVQSYSGEYSGSFSLGLYIMEECPGVFVSRLIPGDFARVVPDDESNRLRSGPGTSNRQIDRIPSGGFFRVLDGPVCADGFAWYQVNYNGTVGWTAEADDEEYWLEVWDEDQQPVLLTGGTGQSDGRRMAPGEFQVEYYCENRGYSTSNDNNNWYCTQGGSRVDTLTQADFDQICRDTYGRADAFALQDGISSIPAYRWQCYGYGN